MNVDDVFNAGKSLKANDLKGQAVVLTMGNASLVEFKDGNKIELEFQGTDRTLILNKTNTMLIKSIYGPNTEGWFGRQIEVYPDRTMYGSEMVDCVRVRAPQQALDNNAGRTQAPAGQAPGSAQASPPSPPAGDLDDSIPF